MMHDLILGLGFSVFVAASETVKLYLHAHRRPIPVRVEG